LAHFFREGIGFWKIVEGIKQAKAAKCRDLTFLNCSSRPGFSHLFFPIILMKLSFKTGVATFVCLLLCLISVQSQIPSDLVRSHPKWTFGIYAGAGFTSQANRPTATIYSLGGSRQGSSFSNGQFEPFNELSLGGYATRRLNDRWSLRSELLVHSKSYGSTALSVGLFPRYRILPWLQLEAGVEARQTLNGTDANESRFWLGAAFGKKDLAFNIRFAPGFTPGANGKKGTLMSTVQIGVSLPLSNISRSSRRKKK
jgi:hypothetical protein